MFTVVTTGQEQQQQQRQIATLTQFNLIHCTVLHSQFGTCVCVVDVFDYHDISDDPVLAGRKENDYKHGYCNHCHYMKKQQQQQQDNYYQTWTYYILLYGYILQIEIYCLPILFSPVTHYPFYYNDSLYNKGQKEFGTFLPGVIRTHSLQ